MNEPRKHPVRDCGSCGAAIVFLTTAAGRLIPVNAATVDPADDAFDYKRHVSHFADCPQAKQWRKGERHR